MLFSFNNLKFEDVKAQIITFLKENSEYFATFDFEGSNMNYIIDAMSYVTMLMSYQVANVANNVFLDSTEIRKNAVSIAKTMGYRPRRVLPARSDLTITFTASGELTPSSTITIPANTEFKSAAQYSYYNEEAIVLKYVSSTVLQGTGPVYEGTKKQYVQISTGQPFQTVLISSNKVSERGFSLQVSDILTETPNPITWTEILNSFSLQDKNSYLVEEDIANEGYVKVLFGDGTIVNYPQQSKMITVNYQESVGPKANNDTLSTPPVSGYEVSGVPGYTASTVAANIVLTSNKAYNGQAYETIDGIRNNAPLSYANVGRLVTENDYNSYLANNPRIKKAKAIGGDILFPGDQTKLGNIYLTGIPSNFSVSGDNYLNLYLTNTDESDISNGISKFRIISTKINFFKPSFIAVEMNPVVEVDKNLTDEQITTIKNDVRSLLTNTILTNFNDFGIDFRDTKMTSILDSNVNLISNFIQYNYSFLLSSESFYGSENDIIDLPIIIKSYDSKNLDMTSAISFVRTIADQKIALGFLQPHDYDLDNFNPIDYDNTMATIYGTIAHPKLNRYIYNEDAADNKSFNIRMAGLNTISNVFVFQNHSNPNTVTNPLSATLGLTLTQPTEPTVSGSYRFNSSVSGYFDSYDVIDSTGVTAGTVYRTASKLNKFIGFVRNVDSIPLSASMAGSAGVFMEAVTAIPFWTSGRKDLAFQELRKGDFICWDPALSGGMWKNVSTPTNIDATSGVNFYQSAPASSLYNQVYYIQGTPSGDLNGYVNTNVTSGDYIIYNGSSTANYKWEKVRNRTLGVYQDPGLDGGYSIPLVTPYQMYLVSDIDIPTTFGGRTNITCSAGDLIYYSVTTTAATGEKYKWKRICNTYSVSSSITKGVASTGNDIESISATADTSSAYYVVTGDPGNFGGSTRINWGEIPEASREAVSGDVLMYIGNNTWNIYSQSFSNIYTIDGSVSASLPISASYGDMFNVTASGTFNSMLASAVSTTDFMIYVGNGEWIVRNTTNHNVPNGTTSSISALPKPGTIGDVLYVTVSGSFPGNNIPGLISPSGDNFVEGDYIIFNGDSWTKMKEYSFDYNTADGRTVFNNLGLNSTFAYKFNVSTGEYDIYFKDIFDGALLGTLKYTGDSTDLPDIGKLKFSLTTSGSYNTTTGANTNVKDLFTSTINKIKIIPIRNSDGSSETDFDSFFDGYIIASVNNITASKTLI